MKGIDVSGLQGLPEQKLEALVEMMYLAAAADGEFSDVERQMFMSNLESLTDGRLDRGRLEALLVQAEKDELAHGREARLASVKERLPDQGARRVALALAVQIMAADGIIRTSERELIMETAEVLEIDADEAANLVRSVSG
ncbi:MAG TPA: tellurite resistance TerB family protein [Polyangiaceae bacterium]|jgi:tellurite resistance protein|nr:tellurite resistance TerB family protein [Polyangiaceae bacterium]